MTKIETALKHIDKFPEWLVEYLKETARHEAKPETEPEQNIKQLLADKKPNPLICGLIYCICTEMDHETRIASDKIGINLSNLFREIVREYFESRSEGEK